MSVKDGYGAVSAAYDAFNTEADYEKWANFAESVFAEFLPSRPEIVLDLGCGTGMLTKTLADYGHDMIGVDISPDMLSEARCKCPPSVLLLCQDVRSFELYGTVGATVCSYDVINHLETRDDMANCFKTVHNYLDPSGIFVFDVNSPFRFKHEYAQNTYSFDEKTPDGTAAFCSWQNCFDEESGVCRFSLTVFTERKAGSGIYSRRNSEWFETCFTRETIESELEKSGFEICAVYGSPEKTLPREDDIKLYFVARAIKDR